MQHRIAWDRCRCPPKWVAKRAVQARSQQLRQSEPELGPTPSLRGCGTTTSAGATVGHEDVRTSSVGCTGAAPSQGMSSDATQPDGRTAGRKQSGITGVDQRRQCQTPGATAPRVPAHSIRSPVRTASPPWRRRCAVGSSMSHTRADTEGSAASGHRHVRGYRAGDLSSKRARKRGL